MNYDDDNDNNTIAHTDTFRHILIKTEFSDNTVSVKSWILSERFVSATDSLAILCYRRILNRLINKPK